MRALVLLAAIAMPVVAWLTNTGTFGPDNGTMSDRYPTLLVAAGYAFAIWGLIFLLDLIYAGWQLTGTRKTDDTLARIAPWAAAGFALDCAEQFARDIHRHRLVVGGGHCVFDAANWLVDGAGRLFGRRAAGR